MDSDHDGKTNGEELGDPDCAWEKGGEPQRNTSLSHPGICSVMLHIQVNEKQKNTI